MSQTMFVSSILKACTCNHWNNYNSFLLEVSKTKIYKLFILPAFLPKKTLQPTNPTNPTNLCHAAPMDHPWVDLTAALLVLHPTVSGPLKHSPRRTDLETNEKVSHTFQISNHQWSLGWVGVIWKLQRAYQTSQQFAGSKLRWPATNIMG